MQKSIVQKIEELPQRPGVYIFKDLKCLVLYVGKAVKLKNRVSSYFKPDAGLGSARIQLMISQISDLDYTVTDNELESLILENNFIQTAGEHKYNVMLRDDKNYLFIKINMQDEIPTIGYDRKPDDKKARYFGPYTSAVLKETLRMLRRIFPYCANSKISSKPCFFLPSAKMSGRLHWQNIFRGIPQPNNWKNY